MIIVEGPDGAGKSTLVERLKNRYDLRIGERGTTDRDLLYTVTVSDTMGALAHAALGKWPVRVWDRLYYSDFVYAPLSVTPRQVAFNSSHQSHIDALVEAMRVPIIVCLPEFEVVLANTQDTHQMAGVKKNLLAIWNSYDDMTYARGTLKPFPDHRIVYDYTDPLSHTDVEVEIEDYLDNRHERSYA